MTAHDWLNGDWIQTFTGRQSAGYRHPMIHARPITRADVVNRARFGGQVKRYHTWPTLRQQQNDSHTWQVMRIYVEIFGNPAKEVWLFLLHHDTPELKTGDTPADAKMDYPDVGRAVEAAERGAKVDLGIEEPDLTDTEKVRVKVCDILERYEFALDEMRMGNRFAEPIADGAIELVEGLLGRFPAEVRSQIRDWMAAR